MISKYKDIKMRMVTLVLALLAPTVIFTTPVVAADTDVSVTVEVVDPNAPAAPVSPMTNNPQWQKIASINPHAIGYLRIPGTNIDTVLMQHPFDTDYYLVRDVYGNYAGSFNAAAASYIDSHCNWGSAFENSKNIIVYGHNWYNLQKGGTGPRLGNPADKQFGQLPSFADFSFAQQVRTFDISSREKDYKVVVFAAMFTDTYSKSKPQGFYYIEANPTKDEFDNIVNTAKRRSEWTYDVDVQATDTLVTLSTCTRRLGSSVDQRFVVMGRLLRTGEDIADACGEISINMNKESAMI